MDTEFDRFLAKNEQVQRQFLYLLKCNGGRTGKIRNFGLSTANFVVMQVFLKQNFVHIYYQKNIFLLIGHL